MTRSSSDNSTNRLIIERMHFNTPYFVIPYLLLGDAIYIALVHLGNPPNRMFTEITFIMIQLEVIYFVFAIKVGINKFREFFEIDKMTDSPLKSLFISEDAFFKYKNQIIGQIFSKWQLYFSILSFLFLAQPLYNLTLPNGTLSNVSIVFGEGGLIWKMLLVSWYLFLGIMYFAVASFNWVLLCIIAGLMQLKNAKGLKIKESVKTFKTLINIKQCNEKAVEKSLEGYYTYNRFVTDAGKITEFLLYFAVMIAIVAILLSINWIIIGGLIFHLWDVGIVRDNIVLAILLDITAILILIFPLSSIHGVLKATKSEISNIINDVYEHNKIRAVVQSASFSQADEGLIKNMNFLKGIIDDVNSLKTWPVDIESTIRLTATTIVPTVLLIVSKINELMGNPK